MTWQTQTAPNPRGACVWMAEEGTELLCAALDRVKEALRLDFIEPNQPARWHREVSSRPGAKA